MTENEFPVGWNAAKVDRVLDHYEHQCEEDALAEDEISFEDTKRTLMEVPIELVPAVRALIAQHQQ